MSTSYPFRPIIIDGLDLYLDFANIKSYSGGTFSTDLIHDNMFSLESGTSFSNSNAGSMVFDGVNNYMDSYNTTNLNLPQGTWSAFIYPTVFTDHQYHTVASKLYNGAWWFGLYQTDGRIQLWVGGAAVISSGFVNLNEWSNIVATWDGSLVKFYINGKLDSVFSFTSSAITNILPVKIGIDYTNGVLASFDYQFTGKIANVLIYNRCLSELEVIDNYNALKNRFI